MKTFLSLVKVSSSCLSDSLSCCSFSYSYLDTFVRMTAFLGLNWAGSQFFMLDEALAPVVVVVSQADMTPQWLLDPSDGRSGKSNNLHACRVHLFIMTWYRYTILYVAQIL